MNLKQLRKQLLELSGRTDLIDPNTYADLGIGYYISAGQTWLDLHVFGLRGIARAFVHCRAGSYIVTIPSCRSIKELWVFDDEVRVRLDKRLLTQLRQDHPNNWRELERSFPKYYSPTSLQLNPDPSKATIGANSFNVNQADVIMTDATRFEGIVILPPPEKDVNVEVVGYFYSNTLVEDSDTNWWSVNHPSTLVNATLREVEIAHRNTQGVNDWTGPLLAMLESIDFDQVEEEITDFNRLEN